MRVSSVAEGRGARGRLRNEFGGDAAAPGCGEEWGLVEGVGPPREAMRGRRNRGAIGAHGRMYVSTRAHHVLASLSGYE